MSPLPPMTDDSQTEAPLITSLRSAHARPPEACRDFQVGGSAQALRAPGDAYVTALVTVTAPPVTPPWVSDPSSLSFPVTPPVSPRVLVDAKRVFKTTPRLSQDDRRQPGLLVPRPARVVGWYATATAIRLLKDD